MKLRKGFMIDTFEKLSTPLEERKLETLQRLYSVMGDNPVLLLGAYARDILFHHLYGIENLPSTTGDIDTCVKVASWESFYSIRRNLRKIGFDNRNAEHPEKFTDENSQEIDVLPFGELSEDGRYIVWPEDNSRWTVLGIQEAYDNSWLFKQPGFQFQIATPPAIIYLKLFAINDRPSARANKDARDIAFVLDNYSKVFGGERLKSSGSDGDILKRCKGNLKIAKAHLAGRDIGRFAEDQTIEKLLSILDKETTSSSRCPIAHSLAKHYKGSFVQSRKVLKRIIKGITDIAHKKSD